MFNLRRQSKPAGPVFDEKEILMGVLKNDPRVMSHVWGQEVYQLQQTDGDNRALSRVDEIVENLCNLYPRDPEIICRVLRTMITVYKIKLNTDIESMPVLHDLISAYLDHHHDTVEVYQ